MLKLRMKKVGGDQNILLKGCDNMDNGSWFWNLVSWVINKQRRNMNDEINDRSINPLIRIADTLDEILRLVKKDMEDSKARITAQWDNDLAKQKLREADDISGDLWK